MCLPPPPSSPASTATATTYSPGQPSSKTTTTTTTTTTATTTTTTTTADAVISSTSLDDDDDNNNDKILCIPDGARTPILEIVTQRILQLEIRAIYRSKRYMSTSEAMKCQMLVSEFPFLCQNSSSSQQQHVLRHRNKHNRKASSVNLFTALVQLRAPLELIRLVHRYNPTAIRAFSYGRSNILHDAIRNESSLQVIQFLYQEYPQAIRMTNQEGEYPLHVACQAIMADHQNGENNYDCRHHEKIIAFLIAAYPQAIDQPDSYGIYPLCLACQQGAPLSILQLLYSEQTLLPDDEGCTPLHVACRQRRHKACNELQQQEKVIEWLLKFQSQQAAILTPDESGWTPLMYAAAFQTPRVLQLLLSTATTTALHNNGGHTSSLMHIASLHNQVDMVAYLCRSRHDDIIIATTITDDETTTPLHRACQRLHDNTDTLAVVQELVQHNRLWLTHINADHQSPLQVAKAAHNPNGPLCRFLKAELAKSV